MFNLVENFHFFFLLLQSPSAVELPKIEGQLPFFNLHLSINKWSNFILLSEINFRLLGTLEICLRQS